MKRVCILLLISILISKGAGSNSNELVFYNNLVLSTYALQTEENRSISKEAKLFITLFLKEYENAYITKIRWQLVDNGSNNSTYIIEGIENNTKYILKLLNWNSSAENIEDVTILGRVERPLKENELHEGHAVEKPLDLTRYITVQQIIDTASKEIDCTIQEWKLVWLDDKAVIQVILWNESLSQKFLIIDAVSGEVLRKIP